MPSNADSMTRIITSHTGEVMTRRTIAHPGIPSFSCVEYAAFCAAPCGTPFDAFPALLPCTARFHSAPVAAPSGALCTAGFNSAPAAAPCAPEEHASPGCTPRSLIMLSATFCGDSSSSNIFASFCLLRRPRNNCGKMQVPPFFPPVKSRTAALPAALKIHLCSSSNSSSENNSDIFEE